MHRLCGNNRRECIDNEANIVAIPRQTGVPELLALTGGKIRCALKHLGFLDTTREELVKSANIANQDAHSSRSEKTHNSNKTLTRVLDARAFLHKEKLWKKMEQGVKCH